MCSKNCCGFSWNVIVLALLAASLGTPWYVFYANIDLDIPVVGEAKCDLGVFFGWKKAYCAFDDCGKAGETELSKYCSSADSISGESFDWRKSATICSSATNSCEETGFVFDVSVVLMAVAFLLAVILQIGFFVRWCCVSSPDNSKLMSIVAFMGFIVNITAVIFFAVRVPKGAHTDFNDLCSVLGDDSHTPCTEFWGSYTTQGLKAGWGSSFGWVIAVVTLPLWLILTCLASPRTENRRPINEQGTGGAAYARYH